MRGPSQRFDLRPEMRQVMTFALHQALQILQMPQLDLEEWVEAEIEKNPVLDHVDRPIKSKVSDTAQLIADQPTLRDHLLKQTREILFEDDLKIAEYLIDQLDERGYLSSALDGMPFDSDSLLRVLLQIQTFDPPGIFARDLQECLWLQLRNQSYSLAEIIVRDHFEDLLQGRFSLIQKRLRISGADMQKALHRISRLHMHPASSYEKFSNPNLTPDLTIQEIDSGWLLSVGTEDLPPIHICSDYVHLTVYQKEEKKQLRGWVTGAKWLQRCIRRRHDMLREIGKLLIRREKSFLSYSGEITPIDIRELAKILHVHESTAWRAIAGKTLACPRGMVPLQQFFSQSRFESLKNWLQRLIQNEDKSEPLTDESIVRQLQQHGVRCARRTIAKYRKLLHFGSASRRKSIN